MADNNKNTPEVQQDMSEILRIRREKLANLQAEGKDPFQQTRFVWDHTSVQIKDNYDEMEAEDNAE